MPSRLDGGPVITGGVRSVTVRSSFVVVANRLPVDEVTDRRRRRQWRRSPGGLVTALHPVLAEHRGTWVGWAGGTGEAPGAVRARRHPPAPGAAQRRGAGALLRGPVQRDASGRSTTTRSRRRSSSGAGARRTARSTARFAEAAGRGRRPGRHRLGAGLPAAARAGDAARAAARPARSASSCTSRSRRSSCSCSCRCRAEILRGLLGADLVGFQQRLAAQNFLRLARHLLGLRVRGPVDRGRRAARSRPARSRSRIDVARDGAAGRRPGGAGAGRADPGRARATRRRSSSASTGSTTPRASSCACKAFRELLADGQARRCPRR